MLLQANSKIVIRDSLGSDGSLLQYSSSIRGVITGRLHYSRLRLHWCAAWIVRRCGLGDSISNRTWVRTYRPTNTMLSELFCSPHGALEERCHSHVSYIAPSTVATRSSNVAHEMGQSKFAWLCCMALLHGSDERAASSLTCCFMDD